MTEIVQSLKQSAQSAESTILRLNHPSAGRFLARWHSALDSAGSNLDEDNRLANRADRALLRRCRSIDEILLSPVFYDIRQKLKSEANITVESDWDNRRLAAVLGAIAWVKSNDASLRFSKQLAGRRKDSQDARLSGLRFRKILKIDELDELYAELVGVIRLLDGMINVADFAKNIAEWKPGTDCYVRKRWAEDYYTTAPDEP